MEKQTIGVLAVGVIALIIGAFAGFQTVNAREQATEQSMNTMMQSMQGMMNAMGEMMKQCEQMMKGGMGSMMAKPEGMSQAEHESHHT